MDTQCVLELYLTPVQQSATRPSALPLPAVRTDVTRVLPGALPTDRQRLDAVLPKLGQSRTLREAVEPAANPERG